MNTEFMSAMRRALEHTRAQNPNEATAVIQAALAAASSAAARRPEEGSSRTALASRGFDDLPSPPIPPAPPATPPPRPASPGAALHAGRGQHDADARSAAGHQASAEPSPTSRSDGRIGRSLGDVLRTLRKGRSSRPTLDLHGRRSSSLPIRPTVPEGAQFLARSYACAAGSRHYKLYVPADLPRGPQGLIIMLHGCTQDPEDFAVGTGMNVIAEARGLLVAYPEQTGTHNPAACWNWFRPGDQRRDEGEPAIIAGITRSLITEFNIDPSRVYAAGLSAGGAMAAVMGEAYPELYVAIGVHSGLPYGSASDVASAFAAMRDDRFAPDHPTQRLVVEGRAVRTIVFHGSLDRTVHPANADRIIAAARARLHGGAVKRMEGRSAGGRRYSRTLALTGGFVAAELWLIEGAGHAWSGGNAAGSYTDPAGPDASAEMARFFLEPAWQEGPA